MSRTAIIEIGKNRFNNEEALIKFIKELALKINSELKLQGEEVIAFGKTLIVEVVDRDDVMEYLFLKDIVAI